MTDQRFPAPLRINIGGENTIREVATLQDACEVLIDWPQARRGPFYQSAREQVEAALDGQTTVAKAHETFVALCDHAGVLTR